MTTRRLPRSRRGHALPRAASEEITWPRALRGRPPLLCLVLLGWLGGGLLATAAATVTQNPNDLTYGLVTTVAACVGLLLLTAVRPQDRSRGGRRRAPVSTAPALDTPLPAHVPAQVAPQHDGRAEPALH